MDVHGVAAAGVALRGDDSDDLPAAAGRDVAGAGWEAGGGRGADDVDSGDGTHLGDSDCTRPMLGSEAHGASVTISQIIIMIIMIIMIINDYNDGDDDDD